jgi:hypothetical protein
MKCQLIYCYCNSITSDGYCYKHSYYTSYDKEFIIKKLHKYNRELSCIKDSTKKSKSMIRLYNYIRHKKRFMTLPEFNRLYIRTLDKAEELSVEIKKYVTEKEYNNFISYVKQIKKFKNK